MRKQGLVSGLLMMLGVFAGFSLGQRTEAACDYTPGAALNALVLAGDSVISLEHLGTGAAEKSHSFHATRLRTSLRAAEELLSDADPIDMPLLELKKSASRIASFTQTHTQFADLQQAAAGIQKLLEELTSDAL